MVMDFFDSLLKLVSQYNLNYFTVSGFPSEIILDDSTIQDFISKGIFEVVTTSVDNIVVLTTFDHGLVGIVATGCQVSPDNIIFKDNLDTGSKFYIKIPIISQVFPILHSQVYKRNQ